MTGFSWNVNIQITGKTPIGAATTAQSVEGTDLVQIAVAPGDADKVVDIQPGGVSAIQPQISKPGYYGSDLTFKASDGSNNDSTVVVKLNRPQVFTGGNIGLFIMDSPRQLKLSNPSSDMSTDVAILLRVMPHHSQSDNRSTMEEPTCHPH